MVGNGWFKSPMNASNNGCYAKECILLLCVMPSNDIVSVPFLDCCHVKFRACQWFLWSKVWTDKCRQSWTGHISGLGQCTSYCALSRHPTEMLLICECKGVAFSKSSGTASTVPSKCMIRPILLFLLYTKDIWFWDQKMNLKWQIKHTTYNNQLLAQWLSLLKPQANL